MATLDTLQIDLSDLVIEDIEVLAQEGSRGIPEFAASSTICPTPCICEPGGCSCSISEEPAAE